MKKVQILFGDNYISQDQEELAILTNRHNGKIIS